jgi:hypothetical protein
MNIKYAMLPALVVATACALMACHARTPGLTDVRFALSRDGTTWLPIHLAGAPAQVLKYVALSSAKVRESKIDLSKLYTNEYLKND